MALLAFFESEPPAWYTWVVPAAGLFVSLTTLVVGRYLLSRWRSRMRSATGAEGPVHDPFDYGSATERRTAARRKGNPVEILITDAEAEVEPVRGWITDRSMGGLCLLLSEPIDSGTVISVKPRNAPPATPWVKVEVRSCKKDRSGYEAGCMFVRTPPWAVLLLFG